MRELKLNQLSDVLDPLDYPIDAGDARAACGDVTLRLADGEVSLGEVLGSSPVDRFETADDLAGELRAWLPRRAVGEPFQSDGDA
ncbi:MAG: hypothetical protein ABEJ61_08925 [Haloferacaceae archaeon]